MDERRDVGGGAYLIPDIPGPHPGDASDAALNPKAHPRARHPPNRTGVGTPGGAEHSTRAKIHFFFDFLAFFALAFFAFFAFLAIVSSQGFHGLKRDTEACLAEGQPRNILDDNPTRFAG